MLYLAIITVRGNKGNWRQVGCLVLAGIVPAALVGAGMAAYNYARFGNALDFGVYDYVGGIQLTQAPFSLSNLGSNLRTFILAPPEPPYFSAYFPFFPAWRPYWGVLYSTPFILLVFVTPLTLLARRWREDAVWVVLGLTLLAAVGLNLLSILTMTMLVGVTERYLVDFLPLVVFLGVLTMWALLSWAPPALRPGRSRIVRAGILVLVFASLSYSTLALFIRHDFAQRSHAIARFADSLVYTVEQWRGVRHGALTLRVSFPAGNTSGREPLLVTAQGRDVLYVEYPAPHEIRLGFFHTGAGGPVSDPITISPGKECDLYVDLGSLYPPKDHPLLAALTESQADALLRRVFVTLDGQTVLNSNSTFYPTSPGELLLGEDPYPIMAPGRFSGRLKLVARHGIPSPESLRGPAGDGPVRLTVLFPPFRAYHSEPLVSTGHRGAGDLLYVTYVAPGKIRFGHDDSGAGKVETPVVNYTPGQAHVLEVDLGSLHAPPAHDPFEGSLIVNFDGRLLMNFRRQFHATAPIDVVFGFNGMDSSVSEMMFAGKIVAVERPGALVPGSDSLAAGLGAVRLSLRFPQFRTGHHEPLLVTGRPGAADIIYVSYDSENAVRLGYDHWGVGGPVSDPIPIDYRATHLIEISMGSLYPPLGSPAWGDAPNAVRRQALGSVKVTLDGKPVMSHPCAAYPATPSEIAIGNNMVGASTAEYQFTGSILWHERLSLQSLPDQQ
jgi:hypothetical protein